jgi:nucleoside-diphosphate-sugar epimerase
VRNIGVIGYGSVGRATALMLASRDDTVRIVQRRKPKSLPDRCTFQAADSLDREATVRACDNLDTVICCLGFPYDSALWNRVWPKAMGHLIDGCSASGARLVFADNLYMYGPQSRPLTEEMSLTNYGRKPALRAEITKLWKSAHDSGRVRAVAVRASDFYGPDAAMSVLSVFGVARLLAGKPALIPYSPQHPHDFTYVPDFARALVSLVNAPDDAYGQAWHVPNAPTRTMRELITLAASLIGVPTRMSVLPPALVPIIGLFSKEVRETAEMRFQWDRPYLVDTSKFAAQFWNDATPFETGLGDTISFYRTT